MEFIDKIDNPLHHTNEKWFINLSNTDIPTSVSNLLQLGDKFCLPPDHDKKHMIHEFIKDLENSKMGLETTARIRNMAIQKFHRFLADKTVHKNIDREIMRMSRLTSNFCKSNPNVIFTRADKGNVTVALDRERYIDEIEFLLRDRDTYITVEKNPIVNIEKNLNMILKRWLQKEFISRENYLSLRSSDSNLPKAYGLPKIHKVNTPFRIIVSSINTALYPVANFVHKIIKDSLPENPKQVKNSFELYGTLSGLKIHSTDVLISLDAISLFTNVPLDLAIQSITNRWRFIKNKTSITLDEFIRFVKYVLSSTYFTFNNRIYKQTFGTPMGSPLSPIIADLVLQDLEEKALNAIHLELPLYYRYVDDIIMAIPRDKTTDILEIFNSFHDRLQFTIEFEDNRCLSFLDLLLKVVDNEIIIDWFHKETFSGRFLSFSSHHPLCHKIGTIYSLVDRAIMLSHPTFRQKNLRFCINVLRENGYPLNLIFSEVNRRLKKLRNVDLNPNQSLQSNNEIERERKDFFVLPYMRNISERITSFFKNSSVNMGFRCLNSLNMFIKVQKDKTELNSKSNVVYKIFCNNCDASYVGQTKRKVKTRITEHAKNIRSEPSKHSVVTNHILETDHSFNWNEIKILDSEPNYYKRLISEMVHIKEQSRGINLQKDTEGLDGSYVCLLEYLSKHT